MQNAHPLRRYRQAKGISLEALASDLGTSAATLSRIENRKQSPDWDLVAQIKAFTKGKLTAEDFMPEATQ